MITVILVASFLVYGVFTDAESEVVGAELTVHTYTQSFTNIHFLEKDGRLLMIDAGLPGDSTNVLSFLESKSLSPEQIGYLILTHAHPDHAGNAAFFQSNYGVKIIAGIGDSTITKYKGADENLCPRGFAGALVKRTVAARRYTSFTPDILVVQKMNLNEIGWEGHLQVFNSHTPGSLTVFTDDLAIVGDLIKGKNLQKTKPAFHVFMCDLPANLKDIKAVANQTAATNWLLGHGGPLKRADVLTFINKKAEKYE